MSDSVTPWAVACQASLSMGFLRQEYSSGLPFLPPGDLPDPGIESHLLFPLRWQADSSPLHPHLKEAYLNRTLNSCRKFGLHNRSENRCSFDFADLKLHHGDNLLCSLWRWVHTESTRFLNHSEQFHDLVSVLFRMPGCPSTLSSNTTPSPSFFWRIILPTLFSRVFFVCVCTVFCLYLICYNSVSVYVLVFWLWGTWAVSSPTRDRTNVPSIGRRRLNHWTTREGPSSYTLYDTISIRTVMGLQNSASLTNQAVIIDWSRLPEWTRILFWHLGMWVYDESLSISSRAGEPYILIAVRS